MVEDWSRSPYRFPEHIRRMKTHLYLLLLAAGVSAAPQMSSMAELLTLLQQMGDSMANNVQNLRIETPDNMDVSETDARNRFVEEDKHVEYMAVLGTGRGKQGCEDVNCVSTIFEGTEQLKTHPAMKKFSVFFQKFERLKQPLTASLAKEGKCDTERMNATIFIEKLMTFIRKASKKARL